MASNPWQVQISGWATDLEHLERHFTSLPKIVIKSEDDNGYCYQSDSFRELTNSSDVLKQAQAELLVLSGILKHVRNSPRPLQAGAVYKLDELGKRTATHLHLHDTISVHVEIGEPVVSIVNADGTHAIQITPLPRTLEIARLAMSDSSVEKVMRLLASQSPMSWVEMYRIYEVVESDMGGEKRFGKCGWVKASDLNRFKHSANSVAVGGDNSRHGSENTFPPKHPMSIEDARAYLNYILHSWISSKLKLADATP